MLSVVLALLVRRYCGGRGPGSSASTIDSPLQQLQKCILDWHTRPYLSIQIHNRAIAHCFHCVAAGAAIPMLMHLRDLRARVAKRPPCVSPPAARSPRTLTTLQSITDSNGRHIYLRARSTRITIDQSGSCSTDK